MRRSHDNERRLVRKCRELNAELVAGAAKVQAALALSEEDAATVAALKKEIEKSWRIVDASHEKELRAKEQVKAREQGAWAEQGRIVQHRAAAVCMRARARHCCKVVPTTLYAPRPVPTWLLRVGGCTQAGGQQHDAAAGAGGVGR